MRYNFDELIDRSRSGCYKYDLCPAVFGTTDLTPMWVADMDFRTPDFILEAIRARLDHPVLGYTIRPKSFASAFRRWVNDHYGWNPDCSRIGFVPGIVAGLGLAIQTFTVPGDKIIVQPPVYPPFFNTPNHNGRCVEWNPLKEVNGRFEMDFDHFESLIDNRTRLFILCNPHNPGGTVWSRETLLQVAELCHKHGILVISDEIHADMTYPENRHIPYASLSDECAQNSITFMSPSKTFNIPGLICSYSVIPNAKLFNQFQTTCQKIDVNGNIFAYVAAEAAYTHGDEWRKQMVEYIRKNARFVVDYCCEHIPEVSAMMPDSSFLVWLDFTKLGLSNEELRRLMIDKAKLGLNDGPTFGPGGEGHQRINVGCSRSIVLDALQRIEKTVNNNGKLLAIND
jgi:cysteine-S-conjugate beta-lyase